MFKSRSKIIKMHTGKAFTFRFVTSGKLWLLTLAIHRIIIYHISFCPKYIIPLYPQTGAVRTYFKGTYFIHS